MLVEFELTLADFRAAQALARSTHKAARFQRILTVFAPATGCFLILSFLLAYFLGSASAIQTLQPALLVGIGLAALPLLTRWSQRQTFRRSFPDQEGAHRITIVVDESGVSSGMPGVAETRYGWGAVRSMVENDRIALIYVAQVNFLMLPKRAFGSSELGVIRSFMQEHGIETKAC